MFLAVILLGWMERSYRPHGPHRLILNSFVTHMTLPKLRTLNQTHFQLNITVGCSWQPWTLDFIYSTVTVANCHKNFTKDRFKPLYDREL